MALKVIHYALGGLGALTVYLIATMDSSDNKLSETDNESNKDNSESISNKDTNIKLSSTESNYKAPVNLKPKDTYKTSAAQLDSKDKTTIDTDPSKWYNFGVSTGHFNYVKKSNSRKGDWGTRNRVLFHMNEIVVGRKLGIV